MQIAQQFGIEPILLLAQIVNFLVILFVLKKFFYKPIVKMLEDRKKRIAQSLKNADTIEEKLKATEERSAAILEKSQKSAEDLMADAKAQAQAIADEAASQAREAAAETMKNALVQIESQREKMQKDLENQTLDLVVTTVKKVLGRNLKEAERKSLTEKSIGQITKNI